MFNPSYIVGLVDGQGSFTVYVKNPFAAKEVKRRTKVEPRFYIKVLEADKDVLYKLKDFFGCGNVYFQKDKRNNHQPGYRYEVTRRADLERIIVPFFLRYSLQLPSKKKDFALFSEIIRRIKRGEHLTDHGLGVLHSIKRQMH